MTFRIIQGDNRVALKTIADNSIDAIVTDPPYGIDFLGKDWDANTGALETYQECLRVLKPGGHILAFSAARTYHHLAVTLEQAGFEIRDQIMWIYSSGFPKSQDIGRSIQRSLGVKQKKKIPKEKQTKTAGFANNGAQEQNAWTGEQVVCTDPQALQWQGWGTALKPAHEPICLARKPTNLSFAKNVQQWGVGGLNIDATRVPMPAGDKFDIRVYKNNQNNEKRDTELTNIEYGDYSVNEPHEGGRFPSNVLGEIPEYQKYFYCPKVSRKERHWGYNLSEIPTDPSGFIKDGVQHNHSNRQAGNNHPTVKPIALMEYLIKLITPPGGTVLDPFNGSGSTGMAAVGLGYDYIGIELDPNYVSIAEKRIGAWLEKDTATNNFDDLFEE